MKQIYSNPDASPKPLALRTDFYLSGITVADPWHKDKFCKVLSGGEAIVNAQRIQQSCGSSYGIGIETTKDIELNS